MRGGHVATGAIINVNFFITIHARVAATPPTGSGEGANKLTLITASKNAHKTRAKRAQNAPLINYACSDLWNQYSRQGQGEGLGYRHR